MKNPFKQSFKLNITLMRILCWYPSGKNSKLHKIQGYVMYVVFLFLVAILIVIQLIIENTYNEMQLLYLSESSTYCFKLMPFLVNGERIKKCIHYFDYFPPNDDVEEKISRDSIKECQRISMAYVIGLVSVAIVYILTALISRIYKLPLQLWLPYDATSTPITYYATITYLFLASLYTGSAASLIDPLMGGLINQATAHLKILKHRLQNLHTTQMNQNNFNRKLIYKNLVKCIQYHNAILRFLEEFKHCFSWVIFSQFFGTTLSICYCCIALTSIPLGSLDAAVFIALFPVLLWQVLFYCYYGTLLFEESDTVVTAVYSSQWYEYDIEIRKLLIILMERSKRPIILIAGKFFELTLETFTTMIKRCYSLMTVLK